MRIVHFIRPGRRVVIEVRLREIVLYNNRMGTLIKFAGVFRFIFGLGILAAMFVWIPLSAHSSLLMMPMMLITLTPITFLVYPLTIIGLYFVFTAKFRWRIDVLALIITVVCLIGLNQFINPARGGIRGDAALEVTVLTENQNPVANLEVDVAEKTGAPPEGGVATTNERGVAAFSVQPGNYVIYFNAGNFPQNLKYPQDSTPVKVEAEKLNRETVILKSR